MEQEIQSHLLRLSILLATSLSSLLEPTEPAVIAGPSKEASQSALAEQILSDLRTIIKAVQQSCTNLTLALRPSQADKKALSTTKDGTSSVSPIAGLDKGSLEAAKAQVASMTNDHVPKIVFLARKAVAEATLYEYVEKSEEDLKKEREERAFVQAKGGHIMVPAYAREKEKLQKVPGKGVGRAWSKAIVSTVFELLDAMGELSKTYMDERTRNVMQKASLARDKADGVQRSTLNAEQQGRPMPTSALEARDQALQATGVVWGICDAALKEKEKLFRDNRAAVQVSWRRRTEVLKDALREFNEATEERSVDENEKEGEELEDDLLEGFGDLTLTNEQKSYAKRYLPLLKSCCQLHSIVGQAHLSSTTTPNQVDLDDLDIAGDGLAENVDELNASLLYRDDDEEEDEEGEAETLPVPVAVKQLVEAAESLFNSANKGDGDRKSVQDQWTLVQRLASEIEKDGTEA